MGLLNDKCSCLCDNNEKEKKLNCDIDKLNQEQKENLKLRLDSPTKIKNNKVKQSTNISMFPQNKTENDNEKINDKDKEKEDKSSKIKRILFSQNKGFKEELNVSLSSYERKYSMDEKNHKKFILTKERKDYFMTKNNQKQIEKIQRKIKRYLGRKLFIKYEKQKLQRLNEKIIESLISDFMIKMENSQTYKDYKEKAIVEEEEFKKDCDNILLTLKKNYYTILSPQGLNKKIKYDSDGWKRFYDYNSEESEIFKTRFNGCFKVSLIFNKQQSEYFIGEMNLDYEKHGYGILINNKAEKFEGYWNHNIFSGWGSYSNHTGNVYIGKSNSN